MVEWWVAWQRWGTSEWDGEKTSNIRKDDRGSVALNEKKSGFWVEDEKQCQAPFNPLANGVFVWTETKGLDMPLFLFMKATALLFTHMAALAAVARLWGLQVTGY